MEISVISIGNSKGIRWVMMDQIRTVDRRRITKIFNQLSEKEIMAIKNVMRETFVD